MVIPTRNAKIGKHKLVNQKLKNPKKFKLSGILYKNTSAVFNVSNINAIPLRISNDGILLSFGRVLSEF